jgi:uncharacterized membrane protein
MTDSEWTNRFLSTAEFFALAEARLSLKTPEVLTDPHIIPRDNDKDADPAVLAAIAAMRPIRTAAVLVPIIARAEPTVLFTQRTAHLADHAGEIAIFTGSVKVAGSIAGAEAITKMILYYLHERAWSVIRWDQQGQTDSGSSSP